MVWQAKRRADAAKLAGMTDKSLRSALRKAHVMAYYNGELEVLRAGERPRNIHRLAEIRRCQKPARGIQASTPTATGPQSDRRQWRAYLEGVIARRDQ